MFTGFGLEPPPTVSRRHELTSLTPVKGSRSHPWHSYQVTPSLVNRPAHVTQPATSSLTLVRQSGRAITLSCQRRSLSHPSHPVTQVSQPGRATGTVTVTVTHRIPREEAVPQHQLAEGHVDRATEGGRVGRGVAVYHLDARILSAAAAAAAAAAVSSSGEQQRYHSKTQKTLNNTPLNKPRTVTTVNHADANCCDCRWKW